MQDDNAMTFSRGDGATTKGFNIPAANWVAGGRLFFAAKVSIDDDGTDGAALIQGNWGDEVVTDILRDGVAYKRYACSFPASATNSMVSEGAESVELLGEFQWVGVDGHVITFPPDSPKIPVIVYFDVKRKTTV